MASIERRINPAGAVSYQVRVRLKGQPTQTATFGRLTDARRWAQQTEAAIYEGRHFKTREAKRRTLADLIDRYTRDALPAKGLQRLNQAPQLRWWREAIGVYTLADVTPALIAEQRDKLLGEETQYKRPRGPATVNRFLATLSHAFTVAIREWGWLDENPVRKVRRPTEPRGRVRFLSDDERERLLAACKESRNPYLYPVVLLALSTGARKGEIRWLTWRDVDLTRRVITLRKTKNGEIRLLPLAGRALEVITALAKVRRIDTDLLFPKGLEEAWLFALKRAEIDDFRFHDLRHSAASYLVMNGASLAEIAEVLGHRTLQMVRRYAHLSEAHTAAVVEHMNRQIFGE